MQEPVPGISAVPDENNARYFHVVVAGKADYSTKQELVHLVVLYNSWDA
jgi:hypothetical protein